MNRPTDEWLRKNQRTVGVRMLALAKLLIHI